MRECPAWFQDALTRVGGVNPYGEPVFMLEWQKVCWALMVWETRESQGSYERWMRDYDHVQFPYPKYGSYRLLQKFLHREVVRGEEVRQFIDSHFHICEEVIRKQEVRTYRMEPCGLMLDLMVPMLMAWRKLSDAAKTQALLQEERLKKEQFLAKVKDARAGQRVRRGSQLVQKRAEIIENGMRRAMAIAAQTGLGMRLG